ncbi:hypothetical protein BDZ45DRAFT_116805 [Acephala macrosclerotiorum]|nr:hypothetical protein BDZ45DRAFT_116805 [Acephala macrosclerotiorum]
MLGKLPKNKIRWPLWCLVVSAKDHSAPPINCVLWNKSWVAARDSPWCCVTEARSNSRTRSGGAGWAEQIGFGLQKRSNA